MKSTNASIKDCESKNGIHDKLKKKSWVYSLVCLVFVVWFLVKHSKGNNDLTNWIIALANVVMASAAIIGVIVAKGWKKEATTDKVIEIGGLFFIEDLKSLQHINASTLVLKQIKSVLVRVKSKGEIDQRNMVALYEHYRFFLEDCEKYFEVYKSADTRNQQVKNLGWVISEKYAENHNEIIYNSFQVFDLSRPIKNEVRSIFYQLGFNVSDDRNYIFDADIGSVKMSELQNIDTALEFIEEAIGKAGALSDNLKFIRVNDPTLFDYFVIK